MQLLEKYGQCFMYAPWNVPSTYNCRQKPQIYPDTTATTTATTAICYGYRRKQVTRCSGYFMGAHMKYLPKQSQQGLIDSEVWETIFHGCRGRVSFQCSINKSAVVWQNEERLSVKWSSFQLTHYLIYLCHKKFSQSGGKPTPNLWTK